MKLQKTTLRHLERFRWFESHELKHLCQGDWAGLSLFFNL